MFLIFVLHLFEIYDDYSRHLYSPLDHVQEYQIWHCMDKCEEKKLPTCHNNFECTLDCLDPRFRKFIPKDLLDKCQNECITLTGCIRKNKCAIQCLLEHHKGLLNPDLKYYDEHEVDDFFFMIIGSIIMTLMIIIFLSYICISDEGNERRRR